ncbi:MAG: hypothetical protein FWG27_08985 [Treponema sp.]|nr:hypothetical protein [Treponema sp.]
MSNRAALLCPLVFAAFLFLSCRPGLIAEQFGPRITEENLITALPPEPAIADTESGDVPQLVLESGNHWAAGIPGFGENALSAFTGEYRIPGKRGTTRIWLTREFLYYEGWANRGSITSPTVLQKIGSEGRVASVTLNNIWTMVILLPKGTEFSLDEEDWLIMLLVSKFAGFSGQSRNLSLPAFISY